MDLTSSSWIPSCLISVDSTSPVNIGPSNLSSRGGRKRKQWCLIGGEEMINLRAGQMNLCCTMTDILTINQEHQSSNSGDWRDCQCDKDCVASHLLSSQTSSRRSLTLLIHWKGVLQEKPGCHPPHVTRCDDRGSDPKVFGYMPFGCQKDVINATMMDRYPDALKSSSRSMSSTLYATR